ncbi:heme biosynthesis HemY N-terminal domain-containing protein [Azospirillum sp. SYSU D00513]|uniref:heme biosynthesis protein HemY n=1 Tax=Azospirillum sp. SYSU D00513 TaxID=2812561 RepID=UPI001A956BE0|nr:heme biosynthesis HemY N-terminal domain-containing protein [Azospirillum sp. SYSU D00513]
MSRAIWFLIKVAIIVAAAIWLVEHPGSVSVNWQGYVVETSFTMAVIIGLVALGVAALLYRLYRAVRGAPTRVRRYSRTRRRERGYKALTQGMVAVAAGDPSTARKMARRADGLLNEPPLTMLLSAQAAQLQGDDQAAKQYFTAMLDRPDTAFLGLRGLLTQAIRSGDRVEALQLARRAQAIQPNTPWLLSTLYDLEARSGDWAAAEGTLQQAMHAKAIPAAEGRHHRAALLLERSFEAERRGRADSALSHAQAAHDLVPGFVPAAVRVARLLIAAGRTKPATKALERAWRETPHPDLSDVYRDLVPGEAPLTRVKRFERLLNVAPNHVEGHLALARASLDAQLWGEARAHLNKALELRPSRRAYQLLAELERSEHKNDEAATAWIAKAASAEPDPAWTCTACGAATHVWSGLCPHCGSFDSLTWKAPAPAVALTLPEQPRVLGGLPDLSPGTPAASPSPAG